MTWKKLQAAGRVQPHTTRKRELDALRALIERDLEDASINKLSDDRRYATAYNAALQSAKMAIACAGYRLASTPGHHRLTFETVGWPWGHGVQISRFLRNLPPQAQCD